LEDINGDVLEADFPRPIRMMPDWITSESPTNQELACSVLKNALFTKACTMPRIITDDQVLEKFA